MITARAASPLEVQVGAELGHTRHTWLAHADHGTGPGIETAEIREVVGELGGQDDEITLHEAGGEARRRASKRAGPRGKTKLASDHETSSFPRVSGSRNAAIPMRLYAIVAKIAMARDNGIVPEM